MRSSSLMQAALVSDAPSGIMRWTLLTLLLTLLQSPSWALESVALHTVGNWTVESRDGEYTFQGPSAAPPTTALQMVAAQEGLDPLYRFGERNYSDVPMRDWLWTCTFDLPPALGQGQPGQQHFLLRFDSLDAVGSVGLNGKTLGEVASAHRPLAFDVTDSLSHFGNVLEVTLESPIQYADRQANAYPYGVPHTKQLGALPHYNFIRKAASDFGWDWGPAFAPVGITGGVWLLAYYQPFLTGMAVQQHHSSNKTVTLTVDAYLQPTVEGASGTLSVSISSTDGKQLWAAERVVDVPGCDPQSCPALGCKAGRPSNSDPQSTCTAGIEEGAKRCEGGTPLGSCTAAGLLGAVQRSISVLVTPPFELWWPHEFGAQPLYQLRLSFAPHNVTGHLEEEEGGGSRGSSLTRRVGFRVVELVREPLLVEGNHPGETFFFTVNGLPLFAKGANVVPLDILETRVTPGAMWQLVADAKAAHMNMLRVWGGGRYFQDEFYDACDEAGVLVWQEAMFACGMYPRNRHFLHEVDTEVRYQMARISSHPSVALWGGNNENEASFTWFPATMANPQLFAVDYSKLFVDTVRQAVLEAAPGAIYLDTSPSNGLISKEPYVKRWGNVADPSFGDVHFYDYNSDALDPQTYPPAKFISEFGYLSFPSFSEYKKVTEPEDWAVDSDMTGFRLRHALGVEELLAQFFRHFLTEPKAVAAFSDSNSSSGDGDGGGGDSNSSRSGGGGSYGPVFGARDAGGVPAPQTEMAGDAAAEEFQAFVYLSQVQQALAYETAISRWRRLKTDNSARTSGVLYWQLNDVWQGPSWSSINYGGSWKLLHNAARDFYTPVAVSGRVDRGAGVVQAHLINDLSLGVEGTMTIDAIPYWATHTDNVTRLASATHLPVMPFSGAQVWAASLHDAVLPAVANATGVEVSRKDLFLRLEFCPTVIVPVGHNNPFAAAESVTPASLLRLRTASSPADEAPADAGDGDSDGDCAGAAPWGVGPGAERCAAAGRLLQCSHNFVFLSEFKDASLALGHVEVAAVEWAGELRPESGETGGEAALPPGLTLAQAAAMRSVASGAAAGVIAVHLDVDPPFLPLFVALESPMEGVFLNNGLHLLPWEDSTVHFVLRGVEGRCAGGGCSPEEREALLHEFREGLTVRWLQKSMETLAKEAGAEAAAEAAAEADARTGGGVRQPAPSAGQLSQASSCMLHAVALAVAVLLLV